jgi:hypothetical protein
LKSRSCLVSREVVLAEIKGDLRKKTAVPGHVPGTRRKLFGKLFEQRGVRNAPVGVSLRRLHPSRNLRSWNTGILYATTPGHLHYRRLYTSSTGTVVAGGTSLPPRLCQPRIRPHGTVRANSRPFERVIYCHFGGFLQRGSLITTQRSRQPQITRSDAAGNGPAVTLAARSAACRAGPPSAFSSLYKRLRGCAGHPGDPPSAAGPSSGGPSTFTHRRRAETCPRRRRRRLVAGRCPGACDSFLSAWDPGILVVWFQCHRLYAGKGSSSMSS